MICKLPGISLYFEANVTTIGTIPILFLHSALGSSEEMNPICNLFPERSSVLVDLPGHGKSIVGNATEEFDSITIASVAEIIAQFLDRLKIPQVDIIGYSLGGYAGLEIARLYPERVRSVITHAMKFYWTPEAIESAISTFSLGTIIPKTPTPERAIRMTKSLIRNFSKKQFSAADIKNSNIPVLITTGERDEFVTAAEVSRLWREIDSPKTSLAIFPGTGHSLRKLPLDEFEQTAREFWDSIRSGRP